MYRTLILALFSTVAYAQQFYIFNKTDFVSRYVWRGMDFGNSFSIQPTLGLSIGGFDVGFWGSYPFTNDASAAEELDLSMAYSISDFSILVTDYYFPNSGLKYSNFKKNGAHTFELGLIYNGTNNIPISLSVYMNFYNDEDKTMYFELAYSKKIKEVNFEMFVGATPGGKNRFYNTLNFNVINIGITALNKISINNNLPLIFSSSFVLNPYLEKAYLLFGLSLKL